MEQQLDKIIAFAISKHKDIEIDIDKSKYRFTLYLTYNKLYQMSVLRTSISNAKGDIYTTSILLRCLIEHYLIFFYAIIECEKTNKDWVGIAYYFVYRQAEYFKQENYWNKILAIKNKSKTDPFKTLNLKYPNLKQGEYEKINTIGGTFSNLDILSKKLISYSDESESMSKKVNANVDLLRFYNILSSYVHGGPMAEEECHYFISNKDAFDAKMSEWNTISETLVYSASIFFFDFLNIETKSKYHNYR